MKKYYSHPELSELYTTVLLQRQSNGQHHVVLTETIFYPTGGGQPHDLGSLNGQPLLDVFEENGAIYHVLAQPLPDNTVHCILDRERRFDHMQQHTGQHLLSAVFDTEYHYSTQSFHLGQEYCSIDISCADLSLDEQCQVEKRVNQLIFQNLPVLTYTVSPEKIANIPIRKLPKLEGDLRIVEIQGLDYSPCSGTHLSNIGQIGLLKLTKAEKYKGMTRVYFLCGQRALADYEHKHQICGRLVGILAVPPSELVTRIEQELAQKRTLEQNVTELKDELIKWKARDFVAKATGQLIEIDLAEGTIEEAQHLAGAILNLGRFLVVINLKERIVLTQNCSKQIHLGQFIKENAPAFGGRGGGNVTSAQAYFPDPHKFKNFQQLIKEKLCPN